MFFKLMIVCIYGHVLCMAQPQLVSELALSVYEASGRPATIKCRIGVDDNDSYDNLTQFIEQVSSKGTQHITQFKHIHTLI